MFSLFACCWCLCPWFCCLPPAFVTRVKQLGVVISMVLLSDSFVKFCALLFGERKYTPGGGLKSLRTCKKCGKTKNLVTHHITYKPSIVATLCRSCHSRITVVNTIGAVAKKVSMRGNLDQANVTRVFLWKWFIKYKGRITRAAVTEALGVKNSFTLPELSYIEKARKRCLGF